MKTRDISGASSSFVGRLRDEVGALRKRNQLKRLEPYADTINEVFERYNTDDDKRTMMYKLLRSPEEGTVTRRKHTMNCTEIAGEIADNFDWLNSDVTRVMARHHDIGHTFLGHSGEWWLSSIKDTYAMPNCVHNAVGARNLMYRYDVPTEIEKEIKKKEPNISNRKLKAIKNDLWLIFDAINGHNGEQSEFSYAPDFSKTKSRFEDELMGCYIKKGFDRTIIPATAEGSLMRISDKISYIPFDLVDIFRNKCNMQKGIVNGEEYDFYEEYRKSFKALGMPDDSLDKLLECKTTEEYDEFAKSIQKILIEDVKKNTKRNNICMSEKTSDVMHGLRDINNKLMVNYAVLKEDHEQYVPVMENFMNSASKFLFRNGLIDDENVRASSIAQFSENSDRQKALLDSFEEDALTYGFAQYISKINPKDFEFTVKSCEKAFEETIKSEIDVARAVATGSIDAVEIQAQGHKKERIEKYIDDFREIIDVTSMDKSMQSIVNPLSNKPIDRLKREIWLDKASDMIKSHSMSSLRYGGEGVESLSKMVAMEIGAQYLASLNDEQWLELYKRYSNPSKETVASLTRKYNTFDFRSEAQKHKTWDNIQKLQSIGNESRMTEQEKISALAVVKKAFKFPKKDKGREK
jgi:dGTP triphosphohydrolase